MSRARREAYLDALARRGSMKRKVYACIAEAEPRGLTPDELAAMLDGRGRSAQPTVTYLHQSGLIYRTRRMRRTRAGKRASVYRIRKHIKPLQVHTCPTCESKISGKQARRIGLR